jgi:hypothetical protein
MADKTVGHGEAIYQMRAYSGPGDSPRIGDVISLPAKAAGVLNEYFLEEGIAAQAHTEQVGVYYNVTSRLLTVCFETRVTVVIEESKE